MVAFRYPVTMSDGFQPDCGPAGTAPMKSESCEVSCGVALNVPGDPLFGMPTQPAREAPTAASTHVRQARVSQRRVSQDREPALAMRGHPGDLGRGTDARAQIGGGALGPVRDARRRGSGP